MDRRGLIRAGAAGAVAVPTLAPTSSASAAGPTTTVKTDVAILGGGAAGIHTAYRLSQLTDLDVRLLEGSDRLGGRIYDVALDPTHPEQVFGMGARRIMETQDVMFALADELGVELEAAPDGPDTISARGVFDTSVEGIRAAAYPLVSESETDLYETLRFGPLRSEAASFPDLRSYVRAAVGTQGYHFLADTFRFRADFAESLSAQAYLEYLDEEWNVCCTPSYPVGGMSQLTVRMAEQAKKNGVRIHRSQPALSIAKKDDTYRYLVRTPALTVRAKRLVIAIDAESFAHVGGAIAAAIQRSSQYQDLAGIKVVTVAQRWPFAWWEGTATRRVWTTEHALNSFEIPNASYAADQLVTRSVYDDDVRTVEFWERTAQLGTAQVEDEIMRGLTYLFPDTTIPPPLETVVKVWPAAWHWLRGGSTHTNAEIGEWAVNPLPGERVSLVGESYHPQRAGWVDGAIKSSLATLNRKFGLDLPGLTLRPTAAACTTHTCRRDGRRP